MLKKCYNVVIPETSSKNGRHIKLLIELVLNKLLLKGTNLKFEGESTWIEFRYEQLSTFYVYRGMVGHGERFCLLKVTDAKNSNLKEGKFREWLKAGSVRTERQGEKGEKNKKKGK